MPPAQQAPQQAPRQAAPAPAPAAPPVAAPKPSPWKGILGGALLGLGLGALFSHFGLGGAMASALGSILMLVLLAGVVFFIIRLIRGKSQPAAQPAAFGGNNVYPMQPRRWQCDAGNRFAPAASRRASAAGAHPVGRAADFDSASFLRVAKAISSACKRHGTRAMWPISANSPRRKCLPS
jgi:predicted lipid-binding transport protein (Tim44 family)